MSGKKSLLSALLALALIFTSVLPVNADVAVSSPSVILIESSTGEVIYEQNAAERRSPASITKIMTLLLTFEAIESGKVSLTDQVTTSEYASSMGGSQVYLAAGEVQTLDTMIKCIAVSSGNDASVAVAEHIAGSEAAFVDLMNQRAQELGMADTHFVNPTGLPAKGHVTSAHDIALMSRELILNHPDIRRFTTIWTDSLRDGAFGLSNTNKLIRFYPGATGLKTGSTDAALYCLSATAERDGMELISVVMGAPTSTQRFEGAKVLLNYGFAAYGLAQAQPPQPLAPIPVILGDQAAVTPRLAEDPTILAPKEKLAAMEVEVQMAESLSAPVDAGAEVGRMTVTSNGETLASIPLTADAAVARLSYWQIFQRCLQKAFLAQ